MRGNFIPEKLENLTAIITSLVAVIAVISWFIWVKKARNKATPQLPGPRGMPLLGYLPFLSKNLPKTFTELAGIHGPIYKLWLGNKLCVVVSSPSLAKQVTRDHDTIFANRDAPVPAVVITYGANDIAWCPYGSHWRNMRKLFSGKLMSKATIDSCYALRKQGLKNTISDVYANKIGKPIDIGQLAVLAFTNVFQNVMWGGILQGEKGANIAAELKERLEDIIVLADVPDISNIFPVLSRFDIQGTRRRAENITIWFDKIISSAIKERNKTMAAVAGGDGKNDQKDFLQFLLELKEHEDSATSLTMTQLKALLMDMIIGGIDTSTTTVEWTMAELMKHPEAMKKVNEELAEVVGMDSSVEEIHLPELKYLDAVVKESLRLHPPVPLLLPRRSSQSSTIGGYTIPKGTTLMLNVWAIHRDPEFWDNPVEFRPERFLNDAGRFDYSGNNFQYMPFGSGRRICAGIPLAERVLMFVLASLLHSFEWKSPDDTEVDLSDKFGVVLRKLKPLVAFPTPRLSNSELYY